jgi:hypothetical protein
LLTVSSRSLESLSTEASATLQTILLMLTVRARSVN